MRNLDLKLWNESYLLRHGECGGEGAPAHERGGAPRLLFTLAPTGLRRANRLLWSRETIKFGRFSRFLLWGLHE